MLRYLCSHVLCLGKVLPLSVVTVSDEHTVSVEPFKRETHSTSYHGGVIAVVRDDVIDEFLIDDLEQILSDITPESLNRANRYLVNSNLYPTSFSSHARILLLR